jgi:uncharacterized membrane protein required for colicin V production
MILFAIKGLNFSDWKVAVVNIVIILFLTGGIIEGYKKGFLESTIKFIGTIVALVGAYMFKNPVSVFLYTHLPFFKFGGVFKGVSVLNILIYEFIAFVLVFLVILVILKIIYDATGLVNKLFSVVAFLGLPNKILGAVVGFIESLVALYFISFLFVFICNFFGFGMKESLVDTVVDIPVLKETFGPSLNSINDIGVLAKDYKDVQDKDEFNYKSLEILLKYDVITKENAKKLIDSKKLVIPNSEELVK